MKTKSLTDTVSGNRLRLAVAAAVLALAAVPAQAEKVETKGGLTVTSDDGQFSMKLGGRIHFDGYFFDEDLRETTSTTEFRRTRLTLSGKAYGWDYKVEQDFAAGDNHDGYRDVYIGTSMGPGYLTIGQFKPYRSMEELTSSNEITMMERPFSSASGLYNGRQFQQGIGYKLKGDMHTLGLSAFNMRNAASDRNEGVGAALRATYTPVRTDSSTLHLGASYSFENANRATPTSSASASYAGRRGPSRTIATMAAGEQVDVIGLEVAGTSGPFYAQAEYAMASFGGGDAGPDQDVTSWYLMGSWMLTGETKPYNGSNGVFRSVKPKKESGAWELTARYDFIENDDVNGVEASATTVGINYYINPAMRFMMNYTMGEDEVTGDETRQLALRGQIAF
ncbi:MAG: porin [Gammaproteobacteria bacterium]|jgi:phosphate-selective porin OprO/OprP|nr:porin [Gammaproteobacteria bacterium]